MIKEGKRYTVGMFSFPYIDGHTYQSDCMGKDNDILFITNRAESYLISFEEKYMFSLEERLNSGNGAYEVLKKEEDSRKLYLIYPKKFVGKSEMGYFRFEFRDEEEKTQYVVGQIAGCGNKDFWSTECTVILMKLLAGTRLRKVVNY